MSSSNNDSANEWEWEMIPAHSSASSSTFSSSLPIPLSENSSTATNPTITDIDMDNDKNNIESPLSSASDSLNRPPSSISQRTHVSSSSSTSSSISSLDPESQLPTSSSSSSSSSSSRSSSNPTDEKLCRICQTDEDPLSMISPCKCRGSMKYVHIECLDKWRKTSVNPRSFFQCDQCLFKYQFSRTHVANALSSPLTKHALTVGLLFLLITFSGYLGKLFSLQSWLFDSLPDIQVDENGNIIEVVANATASAAIDAAQIELSTAAKIWEFLRIDLAHLVLGTVLVGIGGFFSLFFTARLVGGGGGGFYWSSATSSTRASGSGGKSSAEAIFLAIIVLIGLARSGYLIYRWIEERSERMLLTAKEMVVNIQAD